MNMNETELKICGEIELLERELEQVERSLFRSFVRGLSKHLLLQRRAECRETLAGLRLALGRIQQTSLHRA
jgi:Mg2+ and Co2+ transporter CorA